MMFYHGKRAKKRHLARPVLLALSLVLLLSLSVSGTLAYLVANSGPKVNVFEAGKVTIIVDEPGWHNGNSVKNNVTIENTGNVPAYIRATIVANWVDGSGNIIEGAYEGKDYTAIAPAGGWEEMGEYWYWTSKVPAGENTGALINECKVTGTAPAGADHLQLTILSQAIQAEPDDAIEEAWGVTISEGAVTPVSGT